MDGPQESAVLAVLLERRRTAGAWAHLSVDVPGDAPGPNVDFGLEVIDGAGVVGADVPLSRHREGLFPGALGDRRRSEFDGGLGSVAKTASTGAWAPLMLDYPLLRPEKSRQVPGPVEDVMIAAVLWIPHSVPRVGTGHSAAGFSSSGSTVRKMGELPPTRAAVPV